jgi:hypothetical protein
VLGVLDFECQDKETPLFQLELSSCVKMKCAGKQEDYYYLTAKSDYDLVVNVVDSTENPEFQIWYAQNEFQVEDKKALPAPNNDSGSDDTDTEIKMVQGFNGSKISEGVFRSRIGKGCSVCGDIPDADSELADRTVKFLDDDNFLCSNCSSQPSVLSYLHITKEELRDNNPKGGRLDA